MYGSQWRLGPALGLAFLLVLVVAVAPVAGRLDFEANGKNYSTSTVQLWYEGHWKQVRRQGAEKARAENILERNARAAAKALAERAPEFRGDPSFFFG